MIPRRLKAPKMGVRETALVIYPHHRKWVRGFGCSVPGCAAREIEFAHIRNAANSGVSIKPHDAFGYGLCRDHHAEEHHGSETFWAKHNLDPYRIAAFYLRRSPDIEMRNSFYELPAHVQRPLLEAA